MSTLGQPPWVHSSDPTPRADHYQAPRDEVSALMSDPMRLEQPFRFAGERCSVHQLRMLLAEAALTSHDARMTMNETHVWLKTSRRFVQFTRTIGPDGISDVSEDWIEE